MFPQAEPYPVYANPDHPEVVLPACPINKVLRGQAAIVTGASSGIGKAIAIALGRAGANVIVNYLKGDDDAAQVAEEAGRCGLRAAARAALSGDAGLPWTPTGERLLQRSCPDGWLQARLASLRWGSEAVRPKQRPLCGRHGVASRISLQRRVPPGTRRCGRPAGRGHADARSGRGARRSRVPSGGPARTRAVFALSATENRTVLQKTWGLSDFYSSSAEWEYPMGLIQPLNRTVPEILRAWPPGIATQHDEEYLATHSLEFWITSEDLPVAENRVSLDEDGTIRVHYNRNNTRAHERLTHQLASVIARIEGAHFSLADHYRAQVMPIGVNSHQCGTAQFGTHPSTSVLNVNCRTPDVENLYVVDPSFFSSSGAVNPSLTIIANALRVGSHLRDQLAG